MGLRNVLVFTLNGAPENWVPVSPQLSQLRAHESYARCCCGLHPLSLSLFPPRTPDVLLPSSYPAPKSSASTIAVFRPRFEASRATACEPGSLSGDGAGFKWVAMEGGGGGIGMGRALTASPLDSLCLTHLCRCRVY